MNVTSTQVLFKREPQGFPTVADFDVVETKLPELAPGQFLVKGLYLSLDPYMRMLMGGGWKFRGASMAPGQVMVGRVLGEVLESKNAGFKSGELLVASLGWQTYAVSDGTDVELKVLPKDGVPLTAYLGACGSNGLSAWAGLKMIGNPKAGETVLVSAAAGSVGSAVGQIAKSMGCRAIGIAGGEEKCRLVTEEFGFDACCDYKSGDLGNQIAAAASNGVDVYFDNVGAEMLDTILPLLNKFARVPVCGVLSQYNAQGERYGVKNTRLLFDKSLRLQGFLVNQYRDLHDQGRAELEALVASGGLRYRETIASGIENAPEAFIGMLNGRNLGKQLVKLS
ncbi:MAG: NADP-dependent oxidoreductase [Burkholderiales bacterium]|nr:NADP-dependent oxidoreductase [Burkholderiales bacterium]